VHPPCNQKGKAGNPPPTTGAPELYPDQFCRAHLGKSGLLPACRLLAAVHAKTTGIQRAPRGGFRESRIVPTEFCAQAKVGFKSTVEDQYTFRSTATRTSDGRMVDTNVKTIGSGHGCIGQTADRAIDNFYLDLQLGKTARTTCSFHSPNDRRAYRLV
jgi:hypothetical protein